MMNAAFEARGLDWVYVALPVGARGFEAAVRRLAGSGAVGANVTWPHKSRAAALADARSAEVRRTGAANTLVFRGRRVSAHATDGAGFLRFLESARIPVRGRRILVAGSGGAARSLLFHLARAGALLAVSSRRPARSRAVLAALGRRRIVIARRGGALERELLARAGLFVNATPLGSLPGDPLPADPGRLPPSAAVVDLIYGPGQTPLLRAARRRGLAAHDGAGLLVHQACLAFEIWTGVPAPIAVMMREVTRCGHEVQGGGAHRGARGRRSGARSALSSGLSRVRRSRRPRR
jgi:shikimate dehydrogenase